MEFAAVDKYHPKQFMLNGNDSMMHIVEIKTAFSCQETSFPAFFVSFTWRGYSNQEKKGREAILM